MRATIARHAIPARTFLSIENPPYLFSFLMMRAVRMLLVVMAVAVFVLVPVLLAVAALVDHLRGDVDRREGGEDEGLEEAREEGQEEHGELDGDPAPEVHELLDDLVLAVDVAEEAEREGH